MRLEKTEDGAIVYNLYMRNIPRHFTEQLLQDYFSSFGEISSIKIRFNENKRMRYAFINFKEAESATAVLQDKYHNILSQWKLVTKADSWLQPNFEREIDPDSSILTLNDDCLLQIFSYLSRRERRYMSQMNERFKQLFEYTDIRNKPVSLLNLTLMEIRFICREFGHCIQQIDERFVVKLPKLGNLYRTLDYITKYCGELRYLYLVNLPIRDYTKFRLLQNLTKLSLRNCDITDNVCFHLSKIKSLKYLDLSNNNRITGEYLICFPEVTHLNLYDCECLETHHVFTFLSAERTIVKLKSLNIRWVFGKSTIIESLENLENLVIKKPKSEYCFMPDIQGLKCLIFVAFASGLILPSRLTESSFASLETLFIIGELFVLTETQKNFIFSMKNIKKLGLIGCKNLNDKDMTSIATMPELRWLNVAKCPNISVFGLLNLLEKADKLQHVDISQNYMKINTSIRPHQKLEVLNRLKEIKKKHCTLYTYRTEITLYEDEYEECSSPLKQINEISVFPGMRPRDFPYYEFED